MVRFGWNRASGTSLPARARVPDGPETA